MTRKTGWFTFEDGYTTWTSGYSKNELAWEVYRHGKVIKFERT